MEITGVEYVGPAFIGQSDDFARLDMALLRLGAPLDAAFVQPQGLALTATPLAREDKVTVIGFPGSALIYDRTGVPPPGHELEQVLIDVFDRRFGYKRCAPGRVSGLPGTDPRDTKQWAVVHDASTLGGNSGSPVLTLKDGKAQVSALHFYGEQRKANFAHVMERLADVLAGWSIALH